MLGKRASTGFGGLLMVTTILLAAQLVSGVSTLPF